MTGVTMLLKSMGVNIDPAEIEKLFDDIKTRVPQAAAAIQTMSEAVTNIDRRLTNLEKIICPKPVLYINDKSENVVEPAERMIQNAAGSD